MTKFNQFLAHYDLSSVVKIYVTLDEKNKNIVFYRKF